jgi:hypothetical protein
LDLTLLIKEKNIALRTTFAKFPYVKTLETFDFAFQCRDIQ